jgi:hypothetical protein
MTNQWGLAAYGDFQSFPAEVNVTVWDIQNSFNDTEAYVCC